jgi:hypothetical protein
MLQSPITEGLGLCWILAEWQNHSLLHE